MQVRPGKIIHTLQPGQSATAEPNVNHLFRNRSGKPCKFTVELKPASRGFEQSLQVGYVFSEMVNASRMVSQKINLLLPGSLTSAKVTCRSGWVCLSLFCWDGLKKQEKKGMAKLLTEKYVRLWYVLPKKMSSLYGRTFNLINLFIYFTILK